MKNTQSAVLMSRARQACEDVALGPFTPLVFERYEFIGGERGVLLGYPTESLDGRPGICWTHRGVSTFLARAAEKGACDV